MMNSVMHVERQGRSNGRSDCAISFAVRTETDRSGANVIFIWVLAFLLLGVGSAAQAQILQTRSFPHPDHYSSYRQVYLEGDFMDARRAFIRTPVLKSAEGVWIDSIAYHAMIGECLYQMGDLTGALKQYTAACQVYLQYPNWLLRIRIEEALKPSRTGRRGPTWGPSSRAVRVANIPDGMQLLIGNNNQQNQEVLQRGGVFRNQQTVMVDAREIARCIALAIRRRAEILGPAGEYDSVNNDLVNQLSRRPAPPASWTQAWIGVQLGLAYAAKGKTAEATAELQKSILAAGMDHNLTATALLELGKLAFQAEDYAAAASYFFEATFAAAIAAEGDMTQYEIVAEAFRWGAICQSISGLNDGRGSLSPSLATAVEWARRGFPAVEASLLLSAAENCAGVNDPKRAKGYLDRAAQAMRRRECSNGELGARFQFATAQTALQIGDSKLGTTSLAKALAFQRKASRRMFHILYVDGLFTSGEVTTRQAGVLYAKVLRDPTRHDWAHDPLESLAVLTIPHVPAYEHWMLLTIDRKENDNALRISESLRRHRFYTTLPLGGRLLNLRWTLEAPAEVLPQDVAVVRQNLWNRYPAFTQLSQQVAGLRKELAALPLDSDDSEVQRKVTELQHEIEGGSEQLERILETISVSREASAPVFPPNTDVTLVQQRLTPEQRVIVYVATRAATFAFMLGADKYSVWKLEAPAKVRANVAKMLREMGQYDRNQAIGLDELSSDDWKATAAEVLQDLTANPTSDVWDEFSELIIVPDGPLWYVPFEALQIRNGDESVAVIDKVAVRYAPTISLAVPDKRPRSRVSRTAVVIGSLVDRDSESLSLELLEDLQADDPDVFGVPLKPAPATAVIAKTVSRMLVLSDLDNDVKGPYDWTPMVVARGKTAGSLGQWMKTPWGGPDQILLPGFHTPAENALKRGGTGEEMFLTVCGLMSTGSRTVLLSRWCEGGRTSFDLMREFTRELPHRGAAQAWQRSVRLATTADLSWNEEPRVKDVPPDTPPMRAQHPFFWAGFMLVDTGVEPK